VENFLREGEQVVPFPEVQVVLLLEVLEQL
jgi:hypothetical protein